MKGNTEHKPYKVQVMDSFRICHISSQPNVFLNIWMDTSKHPFPDPSRTLPTLESDTFSSQSIPEMRNAKSGERGRIALYGALSGVHSACSAGPFRHQCHHPDIIPSASDMKVKVP